MRKTYQELWETLDYPKGTAQWYRTRILRGKSEYENAVRRVNVPWWAIALLHGMEGRFIFDNQILNGQPFNEITTIKPNGLGPWDNWEQSTIAAIGYKNMHAVDWTSLNAVSEFFESFNGMGYRTRGYNSAYLFGMTNHDQGVKFTSDSVFNDNYQTKQLGVMAQLKYLIVMGDIENPFESSTEDDEEIKQKEILAEAQRQKEFLFEGWSAINDVWKTEATPRDMAAHDTIISLLRQKMETWPLLDDMTKPPVKEEPTDPMPWFTLAQTQNNICAIPGPRHNQEVVKFWDAVTSIDVKDDDTAWCAAFAWWILRESGCTIPASRPATARSLLNYGKKCDLKKGAIVIFWRVSPTDWRGHVGFVSHWDDNYIYVLGGNQSRCVNISRYPRSRVLGYRWPVV